MRFLKYAFSAFLIFFAVAFFGCQYGLNFWQWASDDVDNRWEDKKEAFTEIGDFLNVDGSEYSFLLFTDIHFGKSGFPQTNQLLKFVEEHSDKHPDNPFSFVMFLGDAAETGSFDQFRDFRAFEAELMEKIKDMNVAAFENKNGAGSATDDFKNSTRLNRMITVLGNHDLYNEGYDIWRLQTFPGTAGFKFSVKTTVGGVPCERSFYGLDSASAGFGSKQYNFYSSTFDNDSNKKLVFSHAPLHQMGTPVATELVVSAAQKDRLKMIQLMLENDVDFYFSGHVHSGGNYDWKEFKEYCFKSYTENHGNHFFYTIDVDEEEKTLTVKGYKNLSTNEPSNVDVYKF